MTRKDYCLIAAALKDAHPAHNWDANKYAQWCVDLDRVSCALASDNPRFDRTRFLTACGMPDAPRGWREV